MPTLGGELRKGRASATAIAWLIELEVTASIMDPERDWPWIYSMASPIRARHQPARPKRHRLVPITRLFGLGLDLMAGAEDETTSLHRFKAYREAALQRKLEFELQIPAAPMDRRSAGTTSKHY